MTMALWRETKDVSTTELSGYEFVRLPAFEIDLEMERYVPPMVLRRRLWYKYSGDSDKGPRLKKRMEQWPILFAGFDEAWNAGWARYWSAKKKANQEKEDDVETRVLFEEMCRDDGGAAKEAAADPPAGADNDADAKRKQKEKEEAEADAADDEPQEAQLDIPSNFLDIVETGRAPSSQKEEPDRPPPPPSPTTYYTLTTPSLHVMEFILYYLTVVGPLYGLSRSLSKEQWADKEAGRPVVNEPIVNRARLLVRDRGSIFQHAKPLKKRQGRRWWPWPCPSHLYWQEQIPIWLPQTPWKCQRQRLLEPGTYILTGYPPGYAKPIEQMAIVLFDEQARKALGKTGMGSQTVEALLAHVHQLEETGILGTALTQHSIVVLPPLNGIAISNWLRSAPTLKERDGVTKPKLAAKETSESRGTPLEEPPTPRQHVPLAPPVPPDDKKQRILTAFFRPSKV
jgi:hypothetical protein